MTDEEKINLIDSFDCIDELGKEQFEILVNLSSDKDDFVRSRCAAQLANFENEESLNILMKLLKDEDSFVRTEAYDSIAIFENEKVEKVLRKASKEEVDSLARRYAILSWVDVALSLNHESQTNIDFITDLKANEASDDCLLSCCYAQYLFGDKNVLDSILSYLKNENYQIRCMALSLLNDLLDNNNKQIIKNAITLLLISENTVPVRDRATIFLEELCT